MDRSREMLVVKKLAICFSLIACLASRVSAVPTLTVDLRAVSTSGGTVIDDMHVGSNNDQSASNFFRAYSGQFAPHTPIVRIATLTWTRTSDGTETFVNFRPRVATFGAQWAVDGEAYDPSTGVFDSGQPVSI